MTAKPTPRRSLADAPHVFNKVEELEAGRAFIRGESISEKQPEPEIETTQITEPEQPKQQQQQKSTLVSRLMMEAPEKEPIIRLTVDLPESMHRRLSILCARTGKKKAEIVRMLLDEALEDVKE